MFIVQYIIMVSNSALVQYWAGGGSSRQGRLCETCVLLYGSVSVDPCLPGKWMAVIKIIMIQCYDYMSMGN